MLPVAKTLPRVVSDSHRRMIYKFAMDSLILCGIDFFDRVSMANLAIRHGQERSWNLRLTVSRLGCLIKTKSHIL
jgi:hypothetical protein